MRAKRRENEGFHLDHLWLFSTGVMRYTVAVTRPTCDVSLECGPSGRSNRPDGSTHRVYTPRKKLDCL